MVFKDYYKKREKKRNNITAALHAYFIELSKKEEREREKQEKQRLSLLRENNMEEYRKLLNEAKNERLTYLINQTDSFLQTLSGLVQLTKKKETITVVKESDDDYYDDDFSENKEIQTESREISYYEIAHNVIEKIDVMPSILIGGKLKQYQIEGLEWLVSLYNNHLNGILADEMGLGKTIQAISLLAYLYEIKNVHGKHLIIVPLSTLTNWSDEFQKWCPVIRVSIYQGSKETRNYVNTNFLKTGKFDVLLTTYDYTVRDKNRLKKVNWNYIIVDEGHRLKNSHSKLSSVLGQEYKSEFRLLLTGTPLQNNLPELWSLLNFVLPTVFSSMENFDSWFSKPFSGYSEDGIKLSLEERLIIINRLHQMLRPFLLRREKSLVLDQLPQKKEKRITCELSGWQKILYQQIQVYIYVIFIESTII